MRQRALLSIVAAITVGCSGTADSPPTTIPIQETAATTPTTAGGEDTTPAPAADVDLVSLLCPGEHTVPNSLTLGSPAFSEMEPQVGQIEIDEAVDDVATILRAAADLLEADPERQQLRDAFIYLADNAGAAGDEDVQQRSAEALAVLDQHIRDECGAAPVSEPPGVPNPHRGVLTDEPSEPPPPPGRFHNNPLGLTEGELTQLVDRDWFYTEYGIAVPLMEQPPPLPAQTCGTDIWPKAPPSSDEAPVAAVSTPRPEGSTEDPLVEISLFAATGVGAGWEPIQECLSIKNYSHDYGDWIKVQIYDAVRRQTAAIVHPDLVVVITAPEIDNHVVEYTLEKIAAEDAPHVYDGTFEAQIEEMLSANEE